MNFLLLISIQEFFNTNDIIKLDGNNIKPYSIFEYYLQYTRELIHLSLYKYYCVITIIKGKQSSIRDYKFNNIHWQKQGFF